MSSITDGQAVAQHGGRQAWIKAAVLAGALVFSPSRALITCST